MAADGASDICVEAIIVAEGARIDKNNSSHSRKKSKKKTLSDYF